MLQLLLRLPLSVKCSLLTAVISMAVGVVLIVAGVKASSLLLHESADLFGSHLAKQLAFQAQQPMLRGDRVSLQAILRSHVDNPFVSHGAIYDTGNNALVEAGDPVESARTFRTEITLADDVSGEVAISLDTEFLRNEIRILGWQLLLLTGVLTGLASALVAVPARRLDSWLQEARERLARPLAQTEPPPYPPSDAIGQLLSAIHSPPLPILDDKAHQAEWVVLHVRWHHYGRLSQQWGQAALNDHLADSYLQAQAVAHLYHGELRIYRNDAVTFRLASLPGTDEPLFRALCCAYLLQSLGRQLGAQATVGLLRRHGNRWQLQAAEAQLVQNLHGAGGEPGRTQLQLPTEQREHLLEWADIEENRVTALHPPYDKLLERQLQRLQQSVRRADV